MVRAGPAVARVPAGLRARIARGDAEAAQWLRARQSFRGGGAEGLLRWDAGDSDELRRAAAGAAQEVVLTPTLLRVQVDVPVVRQVYRNNCETAALSMALRGRADQGVLQRLLPLEDPLDPVDDAGGRVWGDPERGFVGRVEGGGYGVFEQPLAQLARRFDAGAYAVRGGRFSRLVSLVRAGRPVVVWVTLGPSSPVQWRTPAGRVVRADQAEHTVVLTGVGPEGIVIADPWTGTVRTEPSEALASMWRTLGRRAVVLSPSRSTLAASRAA